MDMEAVAWLNTLLNMPFLCDSWTYAPMIQFEK